MSDANAITVAIAYREPFGDADAQPNRYTDTHLEPFGDADSNAVTHPDLCALGALPGEQYYSANWLATPFARNPAISVSL